MRPRRRLPRRSWRLEHNQCHSLYLSPSVPPKPQERFHRKYPSPEISCHHTFPLFSIRIGTTVESKTWLPPTRGLNRFAQGIVAVVFVQYGGHVSDDRDAEYWRRSSTHRDSCRCRTCAEWCGGGVVGVNCRVSRK